MLTYRRDIDGLRAVAILSVVLFHAGLGVTGGYVGVDVFFASSGFLITSLIIKDLRSGTFSLWDFWERRARRILPALTVMVATVLVVGSIVLLPEHLEDLGKQVLALLGFSANLWFWRETGYFGAAAEQQPLLHTWSLSLEEQFYLFIPLLLIGLFRIRRAGWCAPLLALGVVASLALAIILVPRIPKASFFLLPTRAWELAAGGLLAFAGPVARRGLREVMGWSGLAAIAVAAGWYSQDTRFPGLAALPPVLGAVLLIWSGIPDAGGSPRSSAHRLLGWAPLVALGLLSYSLYLWHWPLLALRRYLGLGLDSHALSGALVVVALGFAWLSLRFVERPFRGRRSGQSPRRTFALAALAGVALALQATTVWGSGGFPQRLSAEALMFAGGAAANPYDRLMRREDIPQNLTTVGDPAATRRIFVWGDSHAMAVLPAIDAACKQAGIRAEAATASATAPVLGWYFVHHFGLSERAPAYNQAVLDHIRAAAATAPIERVILVARWRAYTQADADGRFAAALKRTIDDLRACGCQVTILREVPSLPKNVPQSTALKEMFGWDALGVSFTAAEHRHDVTPQDTIFASLTGTAGLDFLDPLPALCDSSGLVQVADSDGVFFRDSNHLSVRGSLRLVPAFLALLATPAR
jgi:peptidoglycan/LPS O-acetylase OafA/YrhL